MMVHKTCCSAKQVLFERKKSHIPTQ